MDKEISSTMSSLLKTDKCSPLIVYIVFVIISGITLFNTNAFGKAKLDCSQYTTKTWSGLMDTMRCKKGLPPKEKKVIKKFETVEIMTGGILPEGFDAIIPIEEINLQIRIGWR